MADDREIEGKGWNGVAGMIEIKQTSPKEFEVFDQTGTLQGVIMEGPGFWIVSLGSHTSKACESYERAVFLAKEYCGCSESE